MKNDRKKENVSEDENIRDRDPEPETGPKYPARAGKGLFRRRRIRPEATAVYAGPDYFASIEEVYAGPDFFEKNSGGPAENGPDAADDKKVPEADGDAVTPEDPGAGAGGNGEDGTPENNRHAVPQTMMVYAGPTVTGVYAGPTMMPVYAGPRMARVYAGPAFFVKPAGKEAATSEGGADKSADSKTDGPAFFCPSCGSKLESITKFCPECGADLRKPGGGPVSI